MKLYGYKNGRTLRALWALEEAGAPYEYVEVDLFSGKAREPSFLELNPAGKVPVLVDDGHVITESAAICMHIAEKHEQAQLLPPAGSAARTDCYKWVSFILTELDSALWTIAKHRFALPEDKRVPAVLQTAAWEYGNGAKLLAKALKDREYLLECGFSVADILAGHILLWAKSARVSMRSTSLDSYLQRLEERPALARAKARPENATPLTSA